MKIAIIILHYGSTEDTKKCLDSVFMLEKSNFKLHIILVDNNANFPDRPSAKKSGEFKIIKNSKNLGFAGGVNVGIRGALKNSSDYILVLNNDVVLPSDFMINILKNASDITASVIKFRWEDKWTYDFGGKINWWTGRTTHIESTNKLMSFRAKSYPIRSSRGIFQHTKYGKSLHSGIPDGIPSVGMTNVDYVSGCCMLINRKVFEKIGLFDEGYFFYFEDADFCARAKRNGFNISVIPDVVIYHKMGGAVGRWSNRAIFYNLIGNLRFIRKNLGFRQPIGYAYIFVLSAKILLDKIFGRHQI